MKIFLRKIIRVTKCLYDNNSAIKKHENWTFCGEKKIQPWLKVFAGNNQNILACRMLCWWIPMITKKSARSFEGQHFSFDMFIRFGFRHTLASWANCRRRFGLSTLYTSNEIWIACNQIPDTKSCQWNATWMKNDFDKNPTWILDVISFSWTLEYLLYGTWEKDFLNGLRSIYQHT